MKRYGKVLLRLFHFILRWAAIASILVSLFSLKNAISPALATENQLKASGFKEDSAAAYLKLQSETMELSSVKAQRWLQFIESVVFLLLYVSLAGLLRHARFHALQSHKGASQLKLLAALFSGLFLTQIALESLTIYSTVNHADPTRVETKKALVNFINDGPAQTLDSSQRVYFSLIYGLGRFGAFFFPRVGGLTCLIIAGLMLLWAELIIDRLRVEENVTALKAESHFTI
jgi:hypothetical protein